MLLDAIATAKNIAIEMETTSSKNTILKLNGIYDMIKQTSDALMHAESDTEIDSFEDVISQMKHAIGDIQVKQQSTKKRKMDHGNEVDTKISDIMEVLQAIV